MSALQLLALAIVGIMLAVVLYDARRRLVAASEAPAIPRSRGRMASVSVTVAATDREMSVTTRGAEQRGSWAELVGVEDHGSASVLRFADGEALRVPTVHAFEPVLRTARRTAAARAAHEEAVVARMAHGLSRPEGDETAERGLSVVE